MDIVALYIGSFLLGSIPSAYIIGRLVRGLDIRGYGSGNVGSANLWEHVGKRWVVPLAAVEVLVKGALPVWVALYIMDISRSLYTTLTLEHAVGEAVRFATTGSTIEDPNSSGSQLSREWS